MYKLRANHLEFLSCNSEWINREATRLAALGFAVSIEPWPPIPGRALADRKTWTPMTDEYGMTW